jgi:3-oxoacyl-[acyl-carrier-protein] synthase-3
MSVARNNGIRIAGISCAVPAEAKSICEIGERCFSREFIDKLHKNVGLETLRFTKENQSSGDLGIRAASALLDSLAWERSSVDALIFVSQTPDYIVPPTSCRLQSALGLSEECFVIDTNYGCPAYAQSLMLTYQMISSGMCNRVLLVTAECHHKYISRRDEQTALIFGDAAAATAIEPGESGPAFFRAKVDGCHVEDLVLENYKRADNPFIGRRIDDRRYRYFPLSSGKRLHDTVSRQETRYSSGKTACGYREFRQHVRAVHPSADL